MVYKGYRNTDGVLEGASPRQFPEFFKFKEDWEWTDKNEWDEITFLLNVKGDYGKEEIKTIKSWKLGT